MKKSKLTEYQLLSLKEQATPTIVSGKGRIYALASFIPSLIDELLEIRQELERYKFLEETSHWK